MIYSACSSSSPRPREKVELSGVRSLDDRELLALLLGSGKKGTHVSKLAQSVLDLIDHKGESISLNDLKKLSGIGVAKSCVVIAALEFARRRIHPSGTKIRNPQDVYPLIRHLADRKQENFACVSLNGAHEVTAVRIVTVGLVNTTLVHPREVFSDPIIDRATAVIIAHNHPSGSLEPSDQDRLVTKTLLAAGDLLGIKVLDHIIFTTTSYCSFAEQGWL